MIFETYIYTFFPLFFPLTRRATVPTVVAISLIFDKFWLKLVLYMLFQYYVSTYMHIIIITAIED